MIRESADIEGIALPDHDGRDPRPDGSPTAVLKERGLADDTMVGLKSPASIPPLLHTLARFEAFSGHRMNMDKTIMLLAGAHRGFSVAGGSEAASMLRDVGLSTAYDVTNGQVHNLCQTSGTEWCWETRPEQSSHGSRRYKRRWPRPSACRPAPFPLAAGAA